MPRTTYTSVEHIEQLMRRTKQSPTVLRNKDKLIVVLESFNIRYISEFSVVQMVMLKQRLPKLYRLIEVACFRKAMLPLTTQ